MNIKIQSLPVVKPQLQIITTFVTALVADARLAKTVLLELKKSWLPGRDRDSCLSESQIDQISCTKLLQMDNMLISGAICITLTDLDRDNLCCVCPKWRHCEFR